MAGPSKYVHALRGLRYSPSRAQHAFRPRTSWRQCPSDASSAAPLCGCVGVSARLILQTLARAFESKAALNSHLRYHQAYLALWAGSGPLPRTGVWRSLWPIGSSAAGDRCDACTTAELLSRARDAAALRVGYCTWRGRVCSHRSRLLCRPEWGLPSAGRTRHEECARHSFEGAPSPLARAAHYWDKRRAVGPGGASQLRSPSVFLPSGPRRQTPWTAGVRSERYVDGVAAS